MKKLFPLLLLASCAGGSVAEWSAECVGTMDPMRRLELVRDKVAYLQDEQRTRYFGKSLPLSSNDTDAWKSGRSLLEELEAGYRQCLDAASPGGALAAHQALIAQRTLFQVRADYVRSLVDVWESAVQIQGFLLTGGLDAPLSARVEGTAEAGQDSGSSIERHGGVNPSGGRNDR